MIASNSERATVLDHVGIVVPDLDQAARFFRDHFGASVAFQIDRPAGEQDAAVARLGAQSGSSFALAMLRIGDASLELLQWWPSTPVDSTSQTSLPNVCGSSHVALEVGHVQATIDRMRKVPGVVVLSDAVRFAEGPTPGLTNAFLRTPWGLLIELVAWPVVNETVESSG